VAEYKLKTYYNRTTSAINLTDLIYNINKT
jgi:hypothetical protein